MTYATPYAFKRKKKLEKWKHHLELYHHFQ
jgi:hypothetical protein